MKNSYEKHTRELFKSEQIPFIANCHSLIKTSSPWLHWHENIEFLRCYNGSSDAIIEGSEYSFDADDIITVNSGCTHTFSTQNLYEVSYAYIIIDATFMEENGINTDSIRFSTHAHDKKACELFDKAYTACNEEGNFSILKARTYILEFLFYMCCNHLSNNERTSNTQSISEIKKAVNYIRNHYNQDITLKEVAGIAGFSICYFSRKFKKVTGQTFITFLNAVRCENADTMLKSGARVSDVCFECGFSEPSYFSRTFKAIMGYSPSEAHKMKGVRYDT